jgi:hypothetical protein
VTDQRIHPVSRWLLVRGLPRDPNASPHLTAMLVSAVATVLLVRGLLALAGYPQVGGGGLHIAHVLWGGLLMVVALVLLLSFAGPVVRPLASVLAGIGVGLFIDEVGKFVTSDNNYFYRPATAIMYVVVVCLVLVIHVLHGRRPHLPAEHLAGAVDQAVAGVVGGFTPKRRAQVSTQLHRASGAPGHTETAALVAAIPDDPVELFDPLRLVRLFGPVTRWWRRLRYSRDRRLVTRLPWVTGVVLVLQIGYAADQFGVKLFDRLTGPGDVWNIRPGPIPLALGLASTLGCAVMVAVGIVRLRRDPLRGFLWFHRALLVNLLFTRVFQFDVEQFWATVSVLVDVAMLAVVSAAVARLSRARATAPRPSTTADETAVSGGSLGG